MSVMGNILALIVTLGVLVTVHEFGHFWVARRCGVKVLRFSVGFGPVLLSKLGKDGTEYALAAIPLGGYVKMLDEREAPVEPALLDQAFNRKNVWQRIAVVAAGPLANILFAIFAYWLLFVTGITQVKPVIGGITANTPAAEANVPDNGVITAINGEAVASWSDVNYALIGSLGETGIIRVQVDSDEYALNVANWLSSAEEPDPVAALGIEPFRPEVPAIIDQVSPDSAAFLAGLQSGDKILSVNQQPLSDWFEFVKTVQGSAGQVLQLEVQRGARTENLRLIPATVQAADGSEKGFAGASVVAPQLPADFVVQQKFDPLSALNKGVAKTWDMSIMTLEAMGKMLQGMLSVKNLSGPITIAKVASASAQAGFEAFIGFLAYVSVMLAVMNLLPVPVLDGGHLLFYVIEAIKGSPVSEKIQMMGMKIGMGLLFTLMSLAIFNDLSRL